MPGLSIFSWGPKKHAIRNLNKIYYIIYYIYIYVYVYIYI